MTVAKTESKPSKTKKEKDFEKLAMVEPALSRDIFQPRVSGDNANQTGPTMDSTSVIEISHNQNHEYSNQIMTRAKKAFNPSKLKTLKKEKPKKYLEKAKEQVVELYSCMEALITHTSLFTVSLLIAIGLTLDDVEAYWGKKSKYMKWLRENFGHKHLRYFQHAKQLAKMGEFARKYAAFGKNRLLEFARLKTKLETDGNDLLTKHPFQDITEDIDGLLFSEHVDSIITFYRMIEAGIDFITFAQASLIAAILHKAIPVKDAKGINTWLAQFESQEKKQEAFDHFLLNKLAFPYGTKEDGPINEPQTSLNRVMGKILDFYERVDVEDEVWVLSYKDRIDKDMLVKIHGAIVNLAEKFSINLEEDDQDNNNNDKSEGGTND